jgi:hypothetical protein
MWRWPRATPEDFLPTLPDGAWYQRLQLQAQCPGMTSKAAGLNPWLKSSIAESPIEREPGNPPAGLLVASTWPLHQNVL